MLFPLSKKDTKSPETADRREDEMGLRIDAFIEYGYDLGPQAEAGTIDLTNFLEFRAVQHPDLLLALWGKHHDRIAPFDVSQRDLPDAHSLTVHEFYRDFIEDGEFVSWVYLDELLSRLDCLEVNINQLYLAIRIVFNIMQHIESNLGHRSCKLIYVVW